MDEGDSIGLLIHTLTGTATTQEPSINLTAGMSPWVGIIILVILIFINGFFSAAEFSIVSSNKNKVRKLADEGSKSAQRLLKLVSNTSGFLATIQVGVTFAGFLSSAFASDAFAEKLWRLLDPSGNIPAIRTVSMVLITLLLSYFSLVFGELVPKRIALQNPEKMAQGVAGIIRGFSLVMWPFTKLLTVSTNLILRIFGINPDATEASVTEEEIRMMLDASGEEGNIQITEKEMIDNIFELNDKEVSEIMTHRTNVVALPIDASFEEAVDLCCDEKFSRLPVYEENMDDIVGVLHIKDMLQFLARDRADHFDLRKLMRQPFVTPETKTIDALFREMQQARAQFAIVIDEYGGTAGIVTIEDLIEEIVGNIQDEYDDEEAEIVQESEDTFLVDGRTDPSDVAKAIPSFVEPEDDDFDTIAGYLIYLLDRIPDENEYPEIREQNLLFKVVEMDEKRISKIRITVLPPEEKEEDGDDEESPKSKD